MNFNSTSKKKVRNSQKVLIVLFLRLSSRSEAQIFIHRHQPLLFLLHLHIFPSQTPQSNLTKQTHKQNKKPIMLSAQNCVDDTLAIVFSYIQLCHIPSVMQTCKHWYNASLKEPCRKLEIFINRKFEIKDISISPLRRHISHIDAKLSITMDESFLQSLSTLPNLTSLSGRFEDETNILPEQLNEYAQRIKNSFPKKLEKLVIFCCQSHIMSILPALASAYTLDFDWSNIQELSFAPLLELPNLRHLDVSSYSVNVTRENILILKQLSNLVTLNAGASEVWPSQDLELLCTEPCSLNQLEELDISRTRIGATEMASLIKLPSLTSIVSFDLNPDAYPYLPLVKNLRKLKITKYCPFLDQHLKKCAHLKELIITPDIFSIDVQCKILRAIPSLQSLSIEYCDLSNLDFLQHTPHLTSLSLNRCKGIISFDSLLVLPKYIPNLSKLVLRISLYLTDVQVKVLSKQTFSSSLKSFEYRQYFPFLY